MAEKIKWSCVDLELGGPLTKEELMKEIRKKIDEEFPTDVVDRYSRVHVSIEGKTRPPEPAENK